MIALLLVIAGFCIMFGARNMAAKFVSAAIALVVVICLLPVFIASGRKWLAALGEGLDGRGYLIAGVLVLALIGFIAWRARSWRAGRREAARRRHGAPRERALPPAPESSEEERA